MFVDIVLSINYTIYPLYVGIVYESIFIIIISRETLMYISI